MLQEYRIFGRVIPMRQVAAHRLQETEEVLRAADAHADECGDCREGRFWNSDEVCGALKDAKEVLSFWTPIHYSELLNKYILRPKGRKSSPTLMFDLFKLFINDVTDLYIDTSDNIFQQVCAFLQRNAHNNPPVVIDQLRIHFSHSGSSGDDEYGKRIAKLLSSIPNLSLITISSESFTSAGYETIAKYCKKLQKLHLTYDANYVHSDGISSVSSIPHPRGVHDSIANIETIQEVSYEVRDVGRIFWTKPYRRGNVLYEGTLKWNAWGHLLNIFTNLNITTLYLRDPTDDVIKHVFATLKNLSFLLIESMSSKEALNALLDTKSRNLRALRISQNQFPINFQRLFESFPHLAQLTVPWARKGVIIPPTLCMPKLVKLELDVLEYTTWDTLLPFLKKAPLLRILYLSACTITHEQLDAFLRDNTTITDFGVGRSTLSISEQETLFQKYDEIKLLGDSLKRNSGTALEECFETAMISKQTLREFYKVKTTACFDPLTRLDANIGDETSGLQDEQDKQEISSKYSSEELDNMGKLFARMKLSSYPITKDRAGVCVIINNRDFRSSDGTNVDRRTGTDADKADLHNTFVKFGYGIVTFDNLSAKKMLEKLILVRDEYYGDDGDLCSIVVCVLSHGAKGIVYGADWGSVAKTNIYDIFNNKNCSNLKGKPRVYIFQACQGDNIMGAVDDHRTSHDLPNIPNYMPETSDYIVVNAVIEGYKAMRLYDGSPFIKALCAKLLQEGGTFSFFHVLTRVQDILARSPPRVYIDPDTKDSKSWKMMPEFTSTLTKQLFLPADSMIGNTNDRQNL